MTWTLAPALVQLRREVDLYAPKRSRKSDGTIGDAAHSSRVSDHNPNEEGVVCAIDFTHDPRGGFHAHKFAEQLRLRCLRIEEVRVNYIISNGKIASKSHKWVWREYDGLNAHESHVHVSLHQKPRKYNSPGKWWVRKWMVNS
jgi:hypothetical protein